MIGLPTPSGLAVRVACVAAALSAAVLAGWTANGWRLGTDLAELKAAYAEERAALVTAADAQRTRNLELQRAAERNYTVTRATQAQFFTASAQEVTHAAAPLADCPVPVPVRVRLNAAAACARGDSPAACGSPTGMPDAR